MSRELNLLMQVKLWLVIQLIGYYTQKGMKLDEGKRVIEIMRDIAEYIPLVGGRKMISAIIGTFSVF